MSIETISMASLVRSAAIEPEVCRPVALVLAALHDDHAGHIAVSMARLADLASMSKFQVRKHVHMLLRLGVLEITANAHGGAPGTVPHYRFSAARLHAFAHRLGRTADFFDMPERGGPIHHFVSEGRARMVAQLVGRPGHRWIQFYLQANGELRDYGRVPLAQLLRPWRLEGGWDAVTYPVVEHEDDFPEEIFPGEFEKLQQWAQGAALGRIESVIEA